jgi:hypothetical protein
MRPLLCDEREAEREADPRTFSNTSRQGAFRAATCCTRHLLTRSGSGKKALHSFTASGAQACRCSGVPSVPWPNAAEVAMLNAAPKKRAPKMRRNSALDRYRSRGSHRLVGFGVIWPPETYQQQPSNSAHKCATDALRAPERCGASNSLSDATNVRLCQSAARLWICRSAYSLPRCFGGPDGKVLAKELNENPTFIAFYLENNSRVR